MIGAEAAVASGEGGSMATMLALGIPGHGAVAVLLAAFTMHNVVAGPSLIRQHKDMVYAIILNNMIQAVALLGVGVLFIYAASNVVRVRSRFILPVILVISVMGTFSIDGTIAGPITLVVFTLIGTLMVRYKYPVSATVVGLLLGRIMETESVLSYQISGGNLSLFAAAARRTRHPCRRRAVDGAHGVVEAPAGAPRHRPSRPLTPAVCRSTDLSKKLIIMARINEYMPRDRNPHVPFTPDEIAQTAVECEVSGCFDRAFPCAQSGRLAEL